MQEHQVFGYGSLVHLGTHGHRPARPARLEGWRRVWVHTGMRPVAYLSVQRAQGAAVDGVVASVEAHAWEALDARERAYDRHPVETRLAACGSPAAALVYAVPESHAAPPDVTHPVLLSYVETVAQGFWQVYGPEGAARFFESTAGWQIPVLDDRAAPRYPRHQPPGAEARAFVLERLAAAGARLVPA